MNKVVMQFSVLAIIFLGSYYGLSRVDFMKHFHLAGISRKTENKIGSLIIDGLEKNHNAIENDSVTLVLNEIKDRMCEANGIDKNDITMLLVQNDQVNAFAIPGHHIIVYTGLIDRCDSVSELCGVIAHEMGHIELNHVMKRLASELGVGLIASIASSGNSQVVGQIIKILSSSAFDRKQESDADAIGVTYLEKAHINPRGFVNIMNKLAELHAGTPKAMEWISSHPDSKKRAETIQSLIHITAHDYTPVITDDEWAYLKQAATQPE
jgi:beta-barrel assembly-enhancing protease